jgi:hypothetical protein
MTNTKILMLSIFCSMLIAIASCTKDRTTNGNCSTCTTCINTVVSIDTATTPPVYAGPLKTTFFAVQDSFRYFNNKAEWNARIFKTTHGYYSNTNGVAMKITLDSLVIGQAVTKLSFAHARPGTIAHMVNVKMDNSPLIITTADSLAQYLTPYGYTVNYFSYADVIEYDNGTTGQGVVDSLVIESNNPMHHITVGADIGKSELRNICFHN